jgi:hypothetical protein
MALAARQRTDRLIEEQNQQARQQQATFLKPALHAPPRRYVPSQVQQQFSGQFRQPYIIQSRQQMLSTGIKKLTLKILKLKKYAL